MSGEVEVELFGGPRDGEVLFVPQSVWDYGYLRILGRVDPVFEKGPSAPPHIIPTQVGIYERVPKQQKFKWVGWQ